MPRILSPAQFAQSTKAPLQIYRSALTNPHANLSLEHHLLTFSPPTSRILLFYTNTPSIIIGRNQNPWVECNIPALRSNGRDVALVRRRSGGGTVFHDSGNLNWSTIVPPGTFTRDGMAHTVVRSLSALGLPARVNERHDIVVADGAVERKVSGSAYKLTRTRALHHGTLLLSSDLTSIRDLLKSPARDFITARGVASVSSPVSNLGVQSEEVVDAISRDFIGEDDAWGQDSGWEGGILTESLLPMVQSGIEELQVSLFSIHCSICN
jgi:lipoate-protein ligase A